MAALRRAFTIDLVLLAIQFFLGMAVNAWIVVPDHHPGAHAAHYFTGLLQGLAWAGEHSVWLLRLHAIIGVLLFLWGAHLIVTAMRARRFVALAVVSWIGVIGAGFNGGSFLNYGDAVGTFLMATGFALATFCAAWALGSSVREPLMR